MIICLFSPHPSANRFTSYQTTLTQHITDRCDEIIAIVSPSSPQLINNHSICKSLLHTEIFLIYCFDKGRELSFVLGICFFYFWRRRNWIVCGVYMRVLFNSEWMQVDVNCFGEDFQESYIGVLSQPDTLEVWKVLHSCFSPP